MDIDVFNARSLLGLGNFYIERRHVMTKDELIELAREGMEMHSPKAPEYIVCAALIEALAQPEQEPVYWQWRRKNQPWSLEYIFNSEVQVTTEDSERRALYTTPPQRKPLTDEEIGSCIDEVNLTSQYGHHHFGWHKQFARAIEAAHGIKRLV